MKKRLPKLFSVVKVDYIRNFILKIEFSDGHINTINFESFILNSRNPMIYKYSDINLFKKYSIDDGNLIWNDYELSFSLDDLYKRKTL
ncbi:MAG: hypothetical protein A2033_14265 [Bacteroidetes bacterium GWA2_31_9]|nr:MAG: hypothetical protein A2033_14265 [Bacteroidetes bacterium GWA2_31_9]